MAEEWVIGKRFAHHRLEGRKSQREQSLHFAEEGHNLEHLDAALNEIFSRLQALELPTPSQRLEVLRKLAKARKIRRQYNREANWIVHNNEHIPYQHQVNLHKKYPEQYSKPTTEGLMLRPEDITRIGPTSDDVYYESRYRIAQLDIAYRAGQVAIGQTGARGSLTQELDKAFKLRRRAHLLTRFPVILDNYFENLIWREVHHNDLRDYARIAYLGNADDVWQNVAKTGVQSSSDDHDLIVVPKSVFNAITADYTIWENPANLPTPFVNPGSRQIVVSWSGALPIGVKMYATVVVAKDYEIQYEDVHEISVSSFRPEIPKPGRAAVLIQFERTVGTGENRTVERTPGKVFVVTVS